MDIVLLILAIVCMFVGLLGIVLPILPGPSICYGGFLLLHFSDFGEFSSQFLIIWAIVVVIQGILDFYIPSWGTKKYGGTKSGQRGAMIGTIAGIFIPPQPLGLIIGPFAGAYLGEILHDNKNKQRALRSAWGSFLGFIAGTFLKLVTVVVMCVYFVIEVV